MRREKDILGYMDINDGALYGIHSLRAASNFPDNTPFHKEWYEALGAIKRACYITYKNFSIAVKKKYPSGNSKINLIDSKIINALIEASLEVENGMHFSQFIVPAIQGGAGTSINMNINEIIANRALQISGRKAGSYSYIDPIQHSNICQSTNDVIPTSLKTAVLKLLLQLEQSVDNTRLLMENHERNSVKYLRTAYTQMQEAVPSSYGQLFSTYCESLSRDWWRISKCRENIALGSYNDK